MRVAALRAKATYFEGHGVGVVLGEHGVQGAFIAVARKLVYSSVCFCEGHTFQSPHESGQPGRRVSLHTWGNV